MLTAVSELCAVSELLNPETLNYSGVKEMAVKCLGREISSKMCLGGRVSVRRFSLCYMSNSLVRAVAEMHASDIGLNAHAIYRM